MLTPNEDFDQMKVLICSHTHLRPYHGIVYTIIYIIFFNECVCVLLGHELGTSRIDSKRIAALFAEHRRFKGKRAENQRQQTRLRRYHIYCIMGQYCNCDVGAILPVADAPDML